MKFIDLTGKKIGRLTIISLKAKGKRTKWNCICDCGKEKIIDGQHLRSKKIISCGCASIERISILNKTHGQSNTRIYNIWCGMKTRCYDINCHTYSRYGNRGIKVCDEWKNDFQTFYNWAMANGYQDNLTIDRIDVNGNYEPSNCRWVDKYTQSNNTSRNVIIEFMGNYYSAKQLCTFLNINYKKFLYGYHKINNVDKAIEYAKKYKKKENKNE